MKGDTEMNRKHSRYSKMKKHKRMLKKKYLFHRCDKEFGGNVKLLEDSLSDGEPNYFKRLRNRGFEYWDQTYISGSRRFAKDMTNGVIRAKYRNMIHRGDPDEMEAAHALRGSDYEKMYDYLWTIW